MSERGCFCTIVARNYLPQARVLAESLTACAPGAHLCILVIDGDRGPLGSGGDGLDVLTPSDLALEADEVARMAMLYDVTELATALKPWLLELLLDRGAESVVYLDPDIQVFADLAELTTLAVEHGIVVMPHAENPIPADGYEPSETAILASGVFNLGFIGVGPQSRDLLSWWQAHLRRECRRDPQEQRFVDQRWIDLAAGMFEVHQLRDPTYNVAYWNLHGRDLRGADGRYTVDGRPLRFFHFSGYDPRRPELLFAYHDGRPRILLSEHPVLRDLCRSYGERLLAAGLGGEAPEYGFGRLSDGTPVDRRMRGIYRRALEDAEAGVGPEPPNPFSGDDSAEFLAWLREPVEPPPRPMIGRYLAELLRESRDLRSEFADLGPESSLRFLELCGRPEVGVVDALRPDPHEVAEVRRDLRRGRGVEPRPGVNLVGYLDAVVGVGEMGRIMVDGLALAGVDVAPLVNPETPNRRSAAAPAAAIHQFGDFDVNLLCVNADRTLALARMLGPEAFAHRRTAGLWFWEVDRLPDSMIPAFQVVDEVWVASDFVRAVLAPVAWRPIVKVPIPVPDPAPVSAKTRGELGLPEDRFLYCFTFDFLSVAERKNPKGVLDAYLRAFDPDDGAALLLKSVNGDRRMGDLEQLRLGAADRPDVIVRDEHLDSSDHHALMEHCDCYVSLHRSEGFGLTMAEAMARGKPVIATRHSGNLEFMDDDVARLVDCTLSPVGEGRFPYPPDARWGEPDLDHAAQLMRALHADPVGAAALGSRAAVRIRERHSSAAVAPRLRDVVDQARSRTETGAWRDVFMRGWRASPRPGIPRVQRLDWLLDGTPIDDAMQRAFEHALTVARHGRGAVPPNPDAPAGTEQVIRWLNEPVSPPRRPFVSRYLLHYWRGDPDLRRRFPGVDAGYDRHCFGDAHQVASDEPSAGPAGDEARVAYLEWLDDHWLDDTDIPPRLVPPEVLGARPPARRRGERMRRLGRRLRQRHGA